MKFTLLLLALSLTSSFAKASTLAASVDPEAYAACTALGSGMVLAEDCKAFDGNPGDVAGVRVCVNSNRAELLVTTSEGQVIDARQTENQAAGSTNKIIAQPYALELPMHTVVDGEFDAVFTTPVSSQPFPLVCTSTVNN